MPAPAAAPRPTDFLLLLVLATLWGSSYTLIKLGVATIPPLTLIAARTLIAGALLLLLLRWLGVALPREPAVWRSFLVQSLLNSVFPFTLIAWAEQTVQAGVATILNSTTPVFAFLITLALVRGERATWRKLGGVLAGLSGVCLIVGAEAMTGVGQGLPAQLAIVAASACYGAAVVFGRRFQGIHPAVTAAGALLSGGALLLPVSLLVDRPWTLTPSAVSVLALLTLAILSTAVAFVIYYRLIRTLGSVGTAAQAYLRVPVGVAVGVLALGETVAPSAWIGLVLVVCGVAAMTLPERPRTAAASAA